MAKNQSSIKPINDQGNSYEIMDERRYNGKYYLLKAVKDFRVYHSDF